MRQIIIIGAGHAGAQAAAELREQGFDGRVLLIGNEAHAPYHRPPLSKAFLKAGGPPPFIRAEAFYGEKDIDLRLNTSVVAIDRDAGMVSFADGSMEPFDGLLLATGARIRHAPVAGAELDGVHYLRSLEDAGWLRERLIETGRVVVVGGGFIGLEVAATARALNVQVTVIELAPRLMARAVAPEISAHMLGVHRAMGSDIRLDTGLKRFHGETGVLESVETESGAQLDTALAVVGIGVVPNTELAVACGLHVDNGIIVDQAMRTNDPRIAAAGDCVAFNHVASGHMVRLESVQNAHDQARVAVSTLLGKETFYRDTPWFWSDQGDVKLQMVGLGVDVDQRVMRGTPEDGAFSIFHYAGDRLLSIDSINKPADHMLGRRMLTAGYSPLPAAAADSEHDLKSDFMRWQKSTVAVS